MKYAIRIWLAVATGTALIIGIGGYFAPLLARAIFGVSGSGVIIAGTVLAYFIVGLLIYFTLRD